MTAKCVSKTNASMLNIITV